MKFIGDEQDFANHGSSIFVKYLMEYKNFRSSRPKDQLLTFSIFKAYQAFKLPQKVKPIHLNDIFLEDIDIWDKSPGLPWKYLGYKTNNDIRGHPETIRKVKYFWHLVKMGEDISPTDCISYGPSHIDPVGESNIGAEWEYPATMTLGEAVFALPLIRAYQKVGPIAYGYENANETKFSIYPQHNRFNFKQFDKTVPAWLIRCAFHILLLNVDFVHYKDYGIMDAQKTLFAWDFITNYFINTTIRTPNGLRYRKNCGIASGSYFTQLVGSICNYILITWAYFKQTGTGPADILILNDDSLTVSYLEFSPEEANQLFETIGMKIKVN